MVLILQIMIKLSPTKIKDVWLGDSDLLSDERGEFYRVFCEDLLEKVLGKRRIKQINSSKTNDPGAVRGLHYQTGTSAEMKIIRCIRGQAFDVAVDLRGSSKTFLKYTSVNLCAKKKNFIVIPEGFAHGFQALTVSCELLYLHTESYEPKNEQSIHFNDPMIGINWPLEITNVSEKDKSIKYLTKGFKGYKYEM